MTKLPNVRLAVVEQEKIRNYLLNAAHPDNGGKALVFAGLGYDAGNRRALAEALRELAEHPATSKSMASAHGVKYILDDSHRNTGRQAAVGPHGMDRGSGRGNAASGHRVSAPTLR